MSQLTEGSGAIVRRYQYDDSAVVVADLGTVEGEITVDVVEETAIVVVENGDRSVERELDLPTGAASTRTKNGVVAVEVAQ